jgi:HPt (histidine-containing phosphotransfer) domain-containing protein
MSLDAAALARLRELDPDGRAGVVMRVMRTFDTSLTNTLANMERAGRVPDLAELRRLAHTLKSSSASVGALELSSACAQLESLARDNRAMEIVPVLQTLQNAGRQAQLAVRAMLQA